MILNELQQEYIKILEETIERVKRGGVIGMLVVIASPVDGNFRWKGEDGGMQTSLLVGITEIALHQLRERVLRGATHNQTPDTQAVTVKN